MSEDIIRYDILVQNALRGVIHKALSEVQKTGLPGNHHFFITFVTTAPGVRVSNRVREQYVDQMTIVLQHQYWDLEVTEHGFSVGLSFSDVPETLYIPYTSVRGFYDPSVNFELEFDVESADAAVSGDAAGASAAATLHAVSDDDRADEKPTVMPSAKPAKADAKSRGNQADKPNDAAAGPESESGDVVSLDAFRKKK